MSLSPATSLAINRYGSVVGMGGGGGGGASLQWETAFLNWTFSQSNKKALNTALENAYCFSQNIGAGKWIVTLSIDSTTSNVPLDRYMGVASTLSNPPTAYALNYGSGDTLATAGYAMLFPIQYNANDVVDLILDMAAGKGWLRRNGTLSSGDPVAGTTPGFTFPAAQNPLYIFMGRNNNNGGGNYGSTIITPSNVPSGYSIR